MFAFDNLKGGSKEYLLSSKFVISSIESANSQVIYVNASNGDIIGDVPLNCDVNIACTAQTRYSGTRNITGDTWATPADYEFILR